LPNGENSRILVTLWQAPMPIELLNVKNGRRRSKTVIISSSRFTSVSKSFSSSPRSTLEADFFLKSVFRFQSEKKSWLGWHWRECALATYEEKNPKPFFSSEFSSGPKRTETSAEQGCQIFFVHDTKNGKMYQMNTKCTKRTENIPNVRKIIQMAVNCINIFQCRPYKA
jgi:hypothetical protein